MAGVCSFYSDLRQTDFQSTTAPKESLSLFSRVWICRLQNMNTCICTVSAKIFPIKERVLKSTPWQRFCRHQFENRFE